MRKKKKLEELTLKDNFMFGAVMSEEKNCRGFLEMTLGTPIERIEISKEKSMIYHPGYRGIRLDVYAKDENNTRYNVEMQVLDPKNLGKRSRYYHSQMDMELLAGGQDYEALPDAYVIFVCDFDPFGKKRYCYTFKNCCVEDQEFYLKDGCVSIFLSTCGENEQEVSEELVKFLRFVKADLDASMKDFEDEYVRQLQESILRVKVSRRMEERYMTLEELLANEYTEGRKEGKEDGRAEMVIELLSDTGVVPEDLREVIMSQKDLRVLKKWAKIALNAESVGEFLMRMQSNQ